MNRIEAQNRTKEPVVEKHRKKEKLKWLIIDGKNGGSVVLCSAFWQLSPLPLLNNIKRSLHLLRSRFNHETQIKKMKRSYYRF